MIQKIKLTDTEIRRKIAKTFGVSIPYVSMALSFQRNSETARRIRNMALQNGGKLLREVEN